MDDSYVTLFLFDMSFLVILETMTLFYNLFSILPSHKHKTNLLLEYEISLSYVKKRSIR